MYSECEDEVPQDILEEANVDPQPTVTLLIRGPFGRHAWTMQLRHLPRHKSGTKYHAPNACRPVVMQDTPTRPQVKQKYFPDSVDRVMQCKVDQSIPSLESVLSSDDSIRRDIDMISQLMSRQTAIELNIAHAQSSTVLQECTPPPVCHDFQTARLFLSHFGLLSLDEPENEPESGSHLSALDSSATEFCKDLSLLDNMSPRTCDTVHIFYVRSQQTYAQDIVSNILNENVISPYFSEFIHSLGWPVEVNKHPGWTGHTSTSWKVAGNTKQDTIPKQKMYDGSTHILYWADACSEVAFVIPFLFKSPDSSSEHSSFNTSSLSSWSDKSWSDSGKEKRALSLDLDKQPVPPKRATHRSNLHPHTNTKIMVVWLESFEDHLNLPIGDLLNCMNTGLERGTVPKFSEVLVIYLQLLSTGLFRIHLQGPSGRVGLASPLVDGMVVSRRALGPLVRHTALNMARRRRLDSDSYQAPHLRRRLKIQEIVQKYKRNMSKPELLTYLFSST